MFPNSKVLPKTDNILFGLISYNHDVEEALSYIRKLYGTELGKIEQLVFTLKSGEPLNAYAPFKKYDFILGGTVRSNYQNVLLQFNIGVNGSLKTLQSIRIPDSLDLLEEIRVIKTVKIVDDSIVPIGLSFTPKDLLLVKKVLDDEINAKPTEKK